MNIVKTGHEPKHVCDFPGYKEQKKLGLKDGAIMYCEECNLHWKLLKNWLSFSWFPVNRPKQ